MRILRKLNNKALYLMVVAQNFIYAAGQQSQGFQSLNESGEAAKTTVSTAIKSWSWIFAILPFVIAIGLALLVKMRLDEKEENGQTMPKMQRYTQIVGGMIVGVVISYVLYGLIGKIFLGKTFSESWQTLVTDFWSNIF